MWIKYSLLGARLLSALIWLLVFRYALPYVQLGISRIAALYFAIFVAMAILLYDYALQLFRKMQFGKEWLNAISVLRFLMSVGMAWLGAYGFTLLSNWQTSMAYRPTPRSRQYFTTFFNMLREEQWVLFTLFFSVIALLLLDNAGRLIRLFFQQKKVVQQQEVTIQHQETVLKHQSSELSQAYQQQLDLVGSIQHELGGKLSIAKNTLADLDTALHEAADRLHGFSLQQKIRMRLPGEAESDVDSYADLLTRMYAALNYSLATVQNIRGIIHADPSRFTVETKFVKSWLQQELPRHLPEQIPVEVVFTGPNFELDADYKQLSILVNNIVSNAVRHGYYQAVPPHRLFIQLTQQGTQKRILFHNSGRGLPLDFVSQCFFEPGHTAGQTGNSGLGGYLIGMIAKSHDAQVSLETSTLDGYSTVLSIQFNHT